MRISIVIVMAWLGSTAMAEVSNVIPPNGGVSARAHRPRAHARIRDLSIRAEPLDLHVPYWIGFYDAGGSVRLRDLDAVRGIVEGGKAQAFFHDWLSGEEEP